MYPAGVEEHADEAWGFWNWYTHCFANGFWWSQHPMHPCHPSLSHPEEKFEPPPWQNFQIPAEIKGRQGGGGEGWVTGGEVWATQGGEVLSHNKRLLSHPRRRHLMRLSHPTRRRRRFSHQELSGCGDSRTRHCMVKMEIIGHVLVHL